jgi:hypothetical protein
VAEPPKSPVNSTTPVVVVVAFDTPRLSEPPKLTAPPPLSGVAVFIVTAELARPEFGILLAPVKVMPESEILTLAALNVTDTKSLVVGNEALFAVTITGVVLLASVSVP